MDKLDLKQKDLIKRTADPNQRGSAIVIAVFILVLLSAFVALALSRTASEAAAVGNEASEARTFYAAQGSLEMMTRNFNKVFETKLSPPDTDFDILRGNVPVKSLSPQFTFNQEIVKIGDRATTTLENGPYSGLSATQDKWRLRTTATEASSGIQVQLTRNILNNRIPIFQFGIFYNDDMELHPGARFDFGGRVHSNANMFLMSSAGIYFNSRVSAVGEIITDTARNGMLASSKWGDLVYIKNNGVDVKLSESMGSVLRTGSGTPVFQDLTNNPKLYDPDMPVLYKNPAWASTNEAKFGGNLLSRQKSLDLPLKLGSANSALPLDYVELIKRGKNIGDLYNKSGVLTPVTVAAGDKDDDITASERYYNKTGIRISLANSKAKLPGCASGLGTSAITGPCGVRLDGASNKPALNATWSNADGDGSHGYQPLKMADNYQATRLNGERFRTSAGEVWIKVELVTRDDTTNAIVTKDVTEDILSLGVTEPAPCIYGKFGIFPTAYYQNPITKGPKICDSTNPAPYTDSRSIIKLQRFVMPGVNFVGTSDAKSKLYMSNSAGWSSNYDSHSYIYAECTVVMGGTCPSNAPNRILPAENAHKKLAVIDSIDLTVKKSIVPFPIEMLDAREGLYNQDIDTNTVYPRKTVPWAGVMSMIDIDVANFRRFLSGEFDTAMPTGTAYSTAEGHTLRNDPVDPTKNDVPQDHGWVVYVSDRRGDGDFDGEYDMEDIYGNNDGIKQTGEDINSNNFLDTNYLTEAARYTKDGELVLPASTVTDTTKWFPSPVGTSWVLPSYAAAVDHPFYRRGVRLINGEVLPGQYDWVNSDNTKGFTVASENGIYVQGNYNATGISAVGTPTQSKQYLPQGKIVIDGVLDTAEVGTGANHIPASIASDAITILSNYTPSDKKGWNDAESFNDPFNVGLRKATETTVRFAILSGDAKSSLDITGQPDQGAAEPRLGGGVHNFKRFLETWSGVRMNYCGSLINLFYAHNNNGTYKPSKVYGAPTRNWGFDASFIDPTRLPPGTPYFQFIQTTGFQRTNN